MADIIEATASISSASGKYFVTINFVQRLCFVSVSGLLTAVSLHLHKDEGLLLAAPGPQKPCHCTVFEGKILTRFWPL